jgi:hypothetical protein
MRRLSEGIRAAGLHSPLFTLLTLGPNPGVQPAIVSGSKLPMRMFSEENPDDVYSPERVWVVQVHGSVGHLGSVGQQSPDGWVVIDDATGEILMRGAGTKPIDNIPREAESSSGSE